MYERLLLFFTNLAEWNRFACDNISNISSISTPVKVKRFSNKSVDLSLRVASLDYLGTIAAKLRAGIGNIGADVAVVDGFIDEVFFPFYYVRLFVFNYLLRKSITLA